MGKLESGSSGREAESAAAGPAPFQHPAPGSTLRALPVHLRWLFHSLLPVSLLKFVAVTY